jgi:hypothetical protein
MFTFGSRKLQKQKVISWLRSRKNGSFTNLLSPVMVVSGPTGVGKCELVKGVCCEQNLEFISIDITDFACTSALEEFLFSNCLLQKKIFGNAKTNVFYFKGFSKHFLSYSDENDEIPLLRCIDDFLISIVTRKTKICPIVFSFCDLSTKYLYNFAQKYYHVPIYKISYQESCLFVVTKFGLDYNQVATIAKKACGDIRKLRNMGLETKLVIQPVWQQKDSTESQYFELQKTMCEDLFREKSKNLWLYGSHKMLEADEDKRSIVERMLYGNIFSKYKNLNSSVNNWYQLENEFIKNKPRPMVDCSPVFDKGLRKSIIYTKFSKNTTSQQIKDLDKISAVIENLSFMDCNNVIGNFSSY